MMIDRYVFGDHEHIALRMVACTAPLEIVDAAPDMLTIARDLVARGISVIPLDHPDDTWVTDPKMVGKTPAIKWKPLQDRLPTDAELQDWFGNDRQRNAATVTGAISNIVMVDGDSTPGLAWMRAHLPIPPVRIQTANGEHWPFRHPGVPVKNTVRLRTGDPAVKIDIRGDGGFTVAEGSLHRTGVLYTRLGTWPPISQLPAFDPAWLEPEGVEQPIPKSIPIVSDDERIRLARAWVAAQPPAVQGNGGDQRTFCVAAGVVVGHDLTVDQTFEILTPWNARCQPPWSDADLRAKIQHADQYGKGPRGQRLGQTAFVTSTTGQILKDHQGNVALAVQRCSVDLSYNVFAEQAFIEDPHGVHPLDDAAREDLWLRIDREYRFRPTFSFFEKVVNHLARVQAFHPVRNYLDALVWDRTPRIDRWLITYGGADEPFTPDNVQSYLEAVSAIALMAAVKRVEEPGCKFDEVLILESPQGLNKSSALRALCPRDEWFSDDLPLNVGSKELIERTLGKWIIEASDLAGKRKTEIEQLKATLSRQVDGPARMAYAHHAVQRRRHFIIIGTANSAAYLPDATGARRFWPVRIRKFDVPALVRDRERMWAEAVVRVHRGDSIRLPESLWSAAGVEQEARREIDPWEDKIGDALERIDPSGDGRRRISSEDLFNELVLTVTHRDRPAQLRLSHIMQRLGFARQAIWDPKSKRSAAGYVEDRLSGLDFGKDVEDIVEEPLA